MALVRVPWAHAQDWAALEERRSRRELPRVDSLALETSADSLRVLIIGDSWAQYMWDDGSHDDVLDRFGHADARALSLSLGSDPGPGYIGPEVAISGSEARQWVDTVNYPWLANSIALLQENPSIEWVVLSLGGNDLLAGRSDGGWYKDMDLDVPGSEEAVFQRLETNTFAIVDALLTVRSSLKVILSSYDYPNFNVGFWCFLYACPKREDLSRDPVNDLITDEEINDLMVDVELRRREWCSRYDRLLFDNSIGLMHYIYGDGQTGPRLLPKPGIQDPEYLPLPGGNPLRPSLRSVFRLPNGIDADPIHLDFEGYQHKIAHQTQAHFLPAFRRTPDLSLSSRGMDEDGWSNGVATDTEEIGVGWVGGRRRAAILSFDTSLVPASAVIRRAAIYLTRTGSSGTNPFVSGSLGVPTVDVVGGAFGGNASVEAEDINALADASDAALVHGSVRANGYTLRLELRPTGCEAISVDGLTQFRLAFPASGSLDSELRFADGDAGDWVASGVATFAEITGSARPVLDLHYDVGTAVQDTQPAGARSNVGRLQITPSPFNARVEIRLVLEREVENATLVLFDLRGRLVRRVYDGALSRGEHSWIWDGLDARGRSLPSAVYLVRFESSAGGMSRKLVLVK
jgi:hypothetical protein